MERIKFQVKDFKNSFKEFSKNVNWIVFSMIIVFAPSSWLNVNGLLSETPNMIDSLPEGWRVPSYLSVLSQIAQLVALIYLILKWAFPKFITHRTFIYFILFANLVTCYLLSYFWNKVVKINGEDRSLGLYILGFMSSLMTGGATLSFLPYIAEYFSNEYIFAYYIGESFSALIPGVLSLVQGVTVSNTCTNKTVLLKHPSIANRLVATIQLVPSKLEPNFSVLIYFIIIFVITCFSVFLFLLIDLLPYVKKYWRKTGSEELKELKTKENKEERNEKFYLLFLNFLVTFFMFGFLPGIQSYSTMPYGNLVYSLSINLTYVSLPIAVFISIWSYKVTLVRISTELGIALILTIYIVILTIMSPCPILVRHWIGSVITVIVWFVATFIYIRIRCVIATRLEKFGGNIYLILGLVSLCGQVMGGLVCFLSVDTLRLFKEKPPCVFDFSYCDK